MAINVCQKYGANHHMISKGFANARDYKTGALIKSLAGWYKCDCGQRVICEGHPHFGYAVGDYVTEGAIKGVSTIGGVSAYNVDKSLMRNSSTSTIPGYAVFYPAN